MEERERDGVAEGGNEGHCAANKFNFVLLGIICDHFRSPAGIKRPFADIGGGEGVSGGGREGKRGKKGGRVLELSNKEVTRTHSKAQTKGDKT